MGKYCFTLPHPLSAKQMTLPFTHSVFLCPSTLRQFQSQSPWTDGAVGMLLHCGDWLRSYREWQQRENCCDITQKVWYCDTTTVGIQGNVVFKGSVHPEIKSVIIYSPNMTFFQGIMCWVLLNCNAPTHSK